MLGLVRALSKLNHKILQHEILEACYRRLREKVDRVFREKLVGLEATAKTALRASLERSA
jgi:hypothetical protein